MSKIRVVHYINQFFANIGGEEKADYPADNRRPAGKRTSEETACRGISPEITCGHSRNVPEVGTDPGCSKC